jgi:hypothetical protein
MTCAAVPETPGAAATASSRERTAYKLFVELLA